MFIVKRRSFTVDDDVEGIEIDPNLEEPIKAKLRRESRQGFRFLLILNTLHLCEPT